MMGGTTRERDERHFAGYFLRRLLGRGGMAEVYLAEKTGPGGASMLCALKRILPHHSASPAFVERFVQEMKIAASLKHENIVSVIDFGVDDGDYYIVLERIEGVDLRHLCTSLARKHPSRYPDQERGVLPPHIVACVGLQLAKALAYAHDSKPNGQTGIVHRDISTDNVMVNLHGTVKLMDTGIAKPMKTGMNAVTATDKAYGKVLYMPPEQLRGLPLDGRADLYALGVMLFRLLAARHPYADPAYPNEDDLAKVGRAMEQKRPPMAELLPDAPAGMQQLLEALIRADPGERPASATDIVQPLKQLCGDFYDARAELGSLVDAVYDDRGPLTLPSPVDGPENHDSVSSSQHGDIAEAEPARSPQAPRVVSHVTIEAHLDAPPEPVGATAPLPPTEPEIAAPAVVTPPTGAPRTSALWATLVALCLVLGGLVAFVIGFLADDERTRPSRSDPMPSATVEGQEIGAPAGSTVPADSPPEDASAIADEPAPQGAPGEATVVDPSSPTSEEAAATAPTEEPGTAGMGRVRVYAIPFGDIRIEGRRVPARVWQNLPAGRYRVVVTSAGHRQVREIEVRAGHDEQVIFRF